MDRLRESSRLRTVWDTIRTSLWFVPSLMMAAGVGIAAAAIWVDLNLLGPTNERVLWWIFVSSPDDARAVISTLLSSMITMTSLVFSITMVVLTLAASQFGPRLIRNFMANPRTQIVLGTFVMTILYCLIVLSTVSWRGNQGSFAYSTVSVAIALTGLSAALLVLFIHTLARSIVSESVIERVGHELDDSLEQLDPLGSDCGDGDPDDVLPADFERRAIRFGPKKAGYVQAVEFDALVEAGCAFEVMIGLHVRPGDYMAQDDRAIGVYLGEKDTPELRDKILGLIAMGVHRTPVQDIEYSIRHLVEIAVRALSPGINDPYTAVAVVHRLSASLSKLMKCALPPGVFRDEVGTVRVVCPRPSYATIIGAAFDQIRQNSAGKPLVVIHQIEALSRIGEHAALPSQREALSKQFQALAEDAEREIANASDRVAVGSRAEKAMQMLEQGCAVPVGPR
jgi:uncharacterized membrane protein